jgi:protein-L-isoaspartate(D-aspartate) O-methyltransferase
MTELLLEAGDLHSVLEVGTGSGYQTAILAQLVGQVATVERISALLDRTLVRFRQLGLHQIKAKYDDGQMGWPERGPFDGIVVTASPRVVPEALLAQLAPGGRLVIPLGDLETQTLTVFERQESDIIRTEVEQVRFVPLLGGRS